MCPLDGRQERPISILNRLWRQESLSEPKYSSCCGVSIVLNTRQCLQGMLTKHGKLRVQESKGLAVDPRILCWFNPPDHSLIRMSEPKLATFLINLNRSQDRLAYSKLEFERYGMDFTRIEAVDGEQLDIADYPQATRNGWHYHTPLTINEIACYQSHLIALERFLDSDATHAMILEDDFAFVENPLPCLNSLMKIDDWDIVKLYNWKKRQWKKLFASFVTEQQTPFSLYFNASTAICNTAQIFSRSGAEKFLAKKKHFIRPVDVELKHYWEQNLRIKSLSPPIVTEHKETQPLSTIGHTRSEKSLRAFVWRMKYFFHYGGLKFAYYALTSEVKEAAEPAPSVGTRQRVGTHSVADTSAPLMNQ